MSQPSALENAGPPTETPPLVPTRCVLLIPGAIPSAAAESPIAPSSTPATSTPSPPLPPEASPLPAAPPHEVEDESADPVGDGHSDADLARRLDEGTTAAPAPLPETDTSRDPEKDHG
ncbi:MAG: hypothetical protein KGZ67_11075 [Hydrogenophaga sp.]|jgi:hypothetical protein|nr:hypothetical protein [Hydrogenophaga sp.]